MIEQFFSPELQELAKVLEDILIVLIILIITASVSSILRKVLNKSFHQKKLSRGLDRTSLNFLKNSFSAIIYLIGISIAVYTIPSLRTLSVSLFAGAGVLAVIVGFASQAAFSNIISGIFISIFKPFRVGDRIRVQQIYGKVEDITLRHTVIKTFENIRYVIPNSKVSEETIENQDLGDERIRKFLEFSISYDSDIDKAIKIIQEEVKKHPDHLSFQSDEELSENEEPLKVRLLSFGDSAIVLRVRVWTKNAAAAFRLQTDVNMAVKKRFDKEGIEIPFPHRTIVYKSDVLKERNTILPKKRPRRK